MSEYADHLDYRAGLLSFGYAGPESDRMPRDLREAISEHDMLMGDLLESVEKDREQFELESGQLAQGMRRGAAIAFRRAADECFKSGQGELAERFNLFANSILTGPLSEVTG